MNERTGSWKIDSEERNIVLFFLKIYIFGVQMMHKFCVKFLQMEIFVQKIDFL